MNALHALTAAPTTLSIGGETYLVEPLSLADWGTIEKHLLDARPDALTLVKASLEGLSLDEKRTLLDAALSQSLRAKCVTVAELVDYTATREGLALLLWLALRRRRREMTLDDTHKLLDQLSADDLSRIRLAAEEVPEGSAACDLEDPSKN